MSKTIDFNISTIICLTLVLFLALIECLYIRYIELAGGNPILCDPNW